ncbi:MAG TPA: glycosyltransferase family 2 protein, partial [Thermoanaerobaculia bacterium]|nr:glycosyltransferase family 2 protein [Thermoanaerobaculia bacterium]
RRQRRSALGILRSGVGLIELLFWAAAALLAYTYAGFPVLIGLRALLAPRPVRRAPVRARVSVLIAAHNEADVIGQKLETVLAAADERVEVLVASDGSDDATEEVVAAFADRRVRLLALPRRGKASALNQAVAAASGEILVFTDANSMWARDALPVLLAPFADPNVGGVAGNQVYVDSLQTGLSPRGERRYWDYDRMLKELESRGGSVVSATGALYAIRAALFQPILEGVTDDFYESSGVVAQGRRLVFEPAAVAYERPAAAAGTELHRKIRVITRGLAAVVARRELLNPARHGFYALQLFSHKVLRRLMPVPLLVLAGAAPALWSTHAVYRVAALLQLGFYGAAVAGALLRRHDHTLVRAFTVPFYFCLMNVAAAAATVNVLAGRRITSWEPADRD